MKARKLDRLRLLAVFIIIAGIFYFYANLFAPRLIPRIFRIGGLRQPTTILVLGTDYSFDAQTKKLIPQIDGRTDTIFMIRVDPLRHRLNLLSIPRDSFVAIPGYNWQKINAANVLGGSQLTQQTVENLTGKKIDYVIKVNSYAVVKLVDLLGGLKVYIDKDMYYVDHAQNLYINLKKGWQRLSGKEAESYIRFRHDFYGDIGRIGRQQTFLETLFSSFTRPVNLLKAPLAFAIMQDYLQTDLPLLKTVRLANFIRGLPRSAIQTFTASGEAISDPGAGSIWQLDRHWLANILKDYF